MKHTNDLPYACNKCDKKFPSGSSMRTHIKNIHERKNCSECGMTVRYSQQNLVMPIFVFS